MRLLLLPAFHKKPDGFSLVEAAIVLGVIGVIIGGIWAAASYLDQSFKMQRMASGLSLATENGLRIFGRQSASGTWTNATASAISAGLFPADWIQGNSIKHPFGGDVLVGIKADFQIQLYGMNEQICRNIVKWVATGAQKDLFWQIWKADNNTGYPLPITWDNTTLCNPPVTVIALEANFRN